MCGTGKDTEEPSYLQKTLFDEMGNPAADAGEMSIFFDALREHLEVLKPGDRLSVISCLYWAKTGEDRKPFPGFSVSLYGPFLRVLQRRSCHEECSKF